MDISPKVKNQLKETEIKKGLSALNSLPTIDNKIEKETINESLNNISLNIQNFISNALVNNTTKTKYFDINKEIEEIEKTKKKTIKRTRIIFKIKQNLVWEN